MGKEKKEYSVLVLMSVYNGEKYLREQLDSILGQKGCNVMLLIRDDGSCDGSGKILQEYLNGGQRARFYPVIEGKNIGVIQSFFELLYAAVEFSHEYVALADKDDIWQEDKLAAAIIAIQRGEKLARKEGEEKPCLYASEVQPVDWRGEKILGGIRYPKRNPGFGNALVENICAGCTCVINRELLRLFCDIEVYGRRLKTCQVVMHDFWLYLLASAFGRVIFDTKAHIYYRQHEENTVGMASSVMESYKKRVLNFKKNRGKLRKQAAELKRLYGKKLEEQDKSKAGLLRDFVAGKRKLFFDGRLYRQRKSDNFIMKLFLLLGWL